MLLSIPIFLIMKKILSLFLSFVAFSCGVTGNFEEKIVEKDLEVIIYSKKSLKNKDCLLSKVSLILSKIDKDEVDPYRVKIWKDHKIVKEIIKNPHIKILRKEKKNIIIPIEYRDRLIIYSGESYGLYKLKGGKIDFTDCF